MFSSEEVAPDVVSPHNPENIKSLDVVIALYDFAATTPSHLPLQMGDSIQVLSRSQSGWWDGCLCRGGDLVRGWFPLSHVRLVHYVRPTGDMSPSNEEIENITAANTAANVLIPSLHALVLKVPSDFERPDSSAASRKNSAVSFASSNTSFSSQTKQSEPRLGLSPQNKASTAGARGAATDASRYDYPEDAVVLVSLQDAEALVLQYEHEHKSSPAWLPRCCENGDFIFYCEELGIYCETLPLTTFIPDTFMPSVVVPSRDAFFDRLIIRLNNQASAPEPAPEPDFGAMESATMFDPLKRESNASFAASQGLGSSFYHHFSRPLYAIDGLFYNSESDRSTWSSIDSDFDSSLLLTLQALKTKNKQSFSAHFAGLNKVVTLALLGAKLAQQDFMGTRSERIIRKQLKRITGLVSQIYVNGILHLDLLSAASAAPYVADPNQFSGLANKDVPYYPHASVSSNIRPSIVLSMFSTRSSTGAATLFSEGPNTPITPVEEEISPENPYMEHIRAEAAKLERSMHRMTKSLRRVSKHQLIKTSDYDTQGTSDGEGTSAYDLLPQVYPRFIADEFNGGNWCNPFFTTKNPVLNLSGDELKNKRHLKIVLDQQAYNTVLEYTENISKLTQDTIKTLSPDETGQFSSRASREARNIHVLRMAYKYLYYASAMADIIESFDFTIFCVNKFENGDEASQKSILHSESESALDQDVLIPTSEISFDYPVVLEFFQHKQQMHQSIAAIVMTTQSLTLEDTEVFSGVMNDDDNILSGINGDAARVLAHVLEKRASESRSMSGDSEAMLISRMREFEDHCSMNLNLIQQLVEERDTIVNYATRVMHENFNFYLLVERNNTISPEKTDEINAFWGRDNGTRNSDVPWYLVGDEEQDLLLDIKGNIKGGTKEALVAHLTHHDVCDKQFNEAFLLTFASILPLDELITLLIARYNSDAPEGLSFEEYNNWVSKKQNNVQIRVLKAMKLLLDKYFCESYYEEGLLKRWLSFSRSNRAQQYSVGKQLSALLSRLLEGDYHNYEQSRRMNAITAPHMVQPPAPLIKATLLIKKMKLLDVEYVELARQLTLREHKLYSKVKQVACLAKVWGKKAGIQESYEDITAFIKASNQLTNFVAYMILRKTDYRKRVQTIRYFALVAEKCRQFNNFLSMTAILSALYSSPIHRLKKTWKFLSPDILSQLQNIHKLMNSSKNFNEYRDVLKFIGLEPCVPFFGVFLSDLTFVFHGNPDRLVNRNDFYNFAKRAKTFEILAGIDRFKTASYNFQELKEVQNYLDSWLDKCPTIEEQYQLSLSLEPREAHPGNTRPQNPTAPGSYPWRGVKASGAMKG